MEDVRKLNFWDTTGSILWFVMDGFWMMQWYWLAHLLILPTLIANLVTFRFIRFTTSQVFLTAAMNSWLLMNVLWMSSDLNSWPWLVVQAKLVFWAGVAQLVIALIYSEPGQLFSFRRFRRPNLREGGGL